MTTTTSPPAPPVAPTPTPATSGRGLRRRARDLRGEDVGILLGCALSSAATVWLVFAQFTLLSGPFGAFVCWAGLFLGLYWVVNLMVNGRLAATDRVVGLAVFLGTLGLAVPLALMVGFLVVKGWHLLTVDIFVKDLKGVPVTPVPGLHRTGGLAHAIVGTLEQVAIAVAIGVPAGIVTAVFLNEIGGRFSRMVRTIVTAMSGLPAIMAGLFIYSLWVVGFHQGFSGFAGSLALAVLLLPAITRTTEEVLKVVPSGLREASMALGAPEWRTVWSVVLPTARTGILTSVVLGVARAVGETAPLLVTIFGSNVLNWNPFSGAQESLPLFIWSNIKSSSQDRVDLAYTAALVLVIIVLLLFTLTRILGRPRGGEGRATRAVRVFPRLRTGG